MLDAPGRLWITRRRAHYRSRYGQLKRDLAQPHGTDLMTYAHNKDDFVNDVLGVREKTEAPPVGDPQETVTVSET